jgi:hypothetical protein
MCASQGEELEFKFDHLNLQDADRRLIAKACNERPVYLAPLDKGLSGSDLWQARWELETGWLSRIHVFKIGTYEKLERELVAIRNIVAPIDPNTTYAELFPDDEDPHQLALLRQELAGGGESQSISLRQFIESCEGPERVASVIRRLYTERMRPWHVSAPGNIHHMERVELRSALDWWVSRMDLNRDANRIGRVGVEASLRAKFSLTIGDLQDQVARIGEAEAVVVRGPVHGDLHTQNVLIDEREQLYLIDFGWTVERWRAVDFLMMECSLKFLVTPAHAQLDDLLLMERGLENVFGASSANIDLSRLMYGHELIKVAAGVEMVRRCAFELGAAADAELYRQGLVLLTAGLASVPGMNQAYLFHSLAHHCSLEMLGIA